MYLAGDGIYIHQLAAFEIGQMLSVGRPGKRFGRLGNQRAVREEVFNRELLLRRLCGGGVRSKNEGNENGGQKNRCSRQKEFLLKRKVWRVARGRFEVVAATCRAWRKV